jgi:hypothetical protein
VRGRSRRRRSVYRLARGRGGVGAGLRPLARLLWRRAKRGSAVRSQALTSRWSQVPMVRALYDGILAPRRALPNYDVTVASQVI